MPFSFEIVILVFCHNDPNTNSKRSYILLLLLFDIVVVVLKLIWYIETEKDI